jgi:predicted metal-dependent TIM-barrel fold hydrolase
MAVTHASESVPAFTISQQNEAAGLGALIEHSFFAATASCPGRISLESMRDSIRQVGVEHVILSSDFGQVANGNPIVNFRRYLAKMVELGFNEQEIRRMTRVNPERLLAQ